MAEEIEVVDVEIELLQREEIEAAVAEFHQLKGRFPLILDADLKNLERIMNFQSVKDLMGDFFMESVYQPQASHKANVFIMWSAIISFDLKHYYNEHRRRKESEINDFFGTVLCKTLREIFKQRVPNFDDIDLFDDSTEKWLASVKRPRSP